MAEELLELVKSNSTLNSSNSLSTFTNANILASQITELIIKNIQDKSKLNTYINFLHHSSQQHSRKQCINHDNAPIYIKHLPIGSTNQQEIDLHLPEPDYNEEINTFYKQQAKKKASFDEIRSFINYQTQKSLPNGFESMITNKIPLEIVELNTNKDNKPDLHEITDEKSRKVEIKLAMSVINLNDQQRQITMPNDQHESFEQTTIFNVVEKLSKFETLLICEREFLKWLLMEKKMPVKNLVERFPFLLEEELLNITIEYFQGNSPDCDKYRWIQEDFQLKYQAICIIQELFAIAKFDFNLLNVLMSIIE